MTFTQPQPKPLLQKTMPEAHAQLATLADLKVLVANIDKALGDRQHDRLDIVHMKSWRQELMSQITELERANGLHS